jgi:hypothetical protein
MVELFATVSMMTQCMVELHALLGFVTMVSLASRMPSALLLSVMLRSGVPSAHPDNAMMVLPAGRMLTAQNQKCFLSMVVV